MSKDKDNVVYLDMKTTLDIPVERVLEGAIKEDLEEVTVIGVKGNELFVATHTADVGKIILRIEQAKKKLLELLGDELT